MEDHLHDDEQAERERWNAEPVAVRMLDGRSILVPQGPMVELWLAWWLGETVGPERVDLAGKEWAEAVAFWANVADDPDEGSLRAAFIEACRAVINSD